MSLRDNIVSTSLIRLFAEFETGLKDFWRNGLKQKSEPQAFTLIERQASNRDVPSVYKQNAHLVRINRNRVVHGPGWMPGDDADAEGVSIKEARGFLCKFLGRLPENW